MPEQPQIKFADVVGALPWSVRRRFFSVSEYANGLIEEVAEHADEVPAAVRNEIKLVLFAKALRDYLHSGHTFAVRAVGIAQLLGQQGIRSGTKQYASVEEVQREDGPLLRAVDAVVEEYGLSRFNRMSWRATVAVILAERGCRVTD